MVSLHTWQLAVSQFGEWEARCILRPPYRRPPPASGGPEPFKLLFDLAGLSGATRLENISVHRALFRAVLLQLRQERLAHTASHQPQEIRKVA